MTKSETDLNLADGSSAVGERNLEDLMQRLEALEKDKKKDTSRINKLVNDNLNHTSRIDTLVNYNLNHTSRIDTLVNYNLNHTSRIEAMASRINTLEEAVDLLLPREAHSLAAQVILVQLG